MKEEEKKRFNGVVIAIADDVVYRSFKRDYEDYNKFCDTCAKKYYGLMFLPTALDGKQIEKYDQDILEIDGHRTFISKNNVEIAAKELSALSGYDIAELRVIAAKEDSFIGFKRDGNNKFFLVNADDKAQDVKDVVIVDSLSKIF